MILRFDRWNNSRRRRRRRKRRRRGGGEEGEKETEEEEEEDIFTYTEVRCTFSCLNFPCLAFVFLPQIKICACACAERLVMMYMIAVHNLAVTLRRKKRISSLNKTTHEEAEAEEEQQQKQPASHASYHTNRYDDVY